jgi:hypothetical protein
VQLGGLVKDLDDVGGLDRAQRSGGQEQAGVIVDHVQDL